MDRSIGECWWEGKNRNVCFEVFYVSRVSFWSVRSSGSQIVGESSNREESSDIGHLIGYQSYENFSMEFELDFDWDKVANRYWLRFQRLKIDLGGIEIF